MADWRRIVWLPGTFAVCRLPAGAAITIPEARGTLFSVTRTDEEISVVCEERDAPGGAQCEAGWKAFRLDGPIPFETTGVLASLSSALAQAEVG
ncbi:MAG TPA: ACT domain-containing protein, partial [Thermoanaerobaculia bacterium]